MDRGKRKREDLKTSSENKKKRSKKGKKPQNVNEDAEVVANEKKNASFGEISMISEELGGMSKNALERANNLEKIAKAVQNKSTISAENSASTIVIQAMELSDECSLFSEAAVNMMNTCKGLKDKAEELQLRALRVAALQKLVDLGVEESKLYEFEWANEEQIHEAMKVMCKLKISDEASSLAEVHKSVLAEPGHSQLCRDIPSETMSPEYKQMRDSCLHYRAEPKKFLEHTQPYISYKRDLVKGKKVHLTVASEFTSQAREGFEKMVMVRDEEEYERMSDEGNRMAKALGASPLIPLKPEFLVIPAVPESQEILLRAINDGIQVLLYLKKN